MITRPTTRAVGEFARAHTMEPTQKIATPTSITFLRPKLSLSEPLINIRLAKVSAYAPTTHCRSDTLSCNADWTLANTALMTVLSRNVKKRMESSAANPKCAERARILWFVDSRPWRLTAVTEPLSLLMTRVTIRAEGQLKSA